jgi:hypothetical protein
MSFGFGLTMLGGGVRLSPGAAKGDLTGFLEALTRLEHEDLSAFQRHGWRFGKDVPKGDGSALDSGILARRPGGGLVVAQNRFVVAFQPGFNPAGLLERYPMREKLPFGENLFVVSRPLPGDGDLPQRIEEELEVLQNEGGETVRWVEPVFTFHLKAPPPPPPPSPLSFLKKFLWSWAPKPKSDYDSTDQWQWPHIALSDAWKTTRGAGTTVAVIDDGFYDCTQLPGSKTILSLDADGKVAKAAWPGVYHGTFCASLVGSPVDQSLGNGVAPECTMRLVAVSDVMNSTGFAVALKRCSDDGADVITCSLGPNGGTWLNLKTLQDAIDDVHKTGRAGKGAVVVWAASNKAGLIQNTDLESYGPLLCVGSSDEKDRRGAGLRGTGIDVIAPGVNVRGLRSDDGSSFSIYEDSGSSLAAPIVAGVAALVIAANHDLRCDAVVDILQQNCDQRPAKPPSDDLGWGRVNAAKAVTAALPKPAP